LVRESAEASKLRAEVAELRLVLERQRKEADEQRAEASKANTSTRRGGTARSQLAFLSPAPPSLLCLAVTFAAEMYFASVLTAEDYLLNQPRMQAVHVLDCLVEADFMSFSWAWIFL